VKGRCINPGLAEAEAIVSRTPISFYGGVDPNTGNVIERGHELEGKCVKGKILVFPRGKGSTVGSYTIYALARNKTNPAAIVTAQAEAIVATGVILGDIPCVDRIQVEGIRTGDILRIDAGAGEVYIVQQGPNRGRGAG
jgi:predicted aconitase with swiveling domain